jgi:AraC-like DNA-binding protein
MALNDIDSAAQNVPLGWLEPTVHTVYLKLLARTNDLQAIELVGNPNEARLHTYLEANNMLQRMGLSGSPDQGMLFGLAVPIVAHGFMGQAAISAPDLRGALEILARYTAIRSDFYRSGFTAGRKEGILSFVPRFDLGTHAPFVQAATIFSFMQLFEFLLPPLDLRQLQLELPWKLRDSATLQRKTGIAPPRYKSGSAVSLRLPAGLLARENISADERQYVMAVKACEEELAGLRGAMSARVKRVLEQHEGGHWPRLTEVAACLDVSRRTLVRKLAVEGTSYGALLNQTRCNFACWYLLNTQVSIDTISEKLGYSDGSNFSRTFRKWMSVTPNSYRRNHHC